MEAGAGVAAGRGGSLPMPSQSARKEWRAVSEHSIRNSGNEELERPKLSQSDERTIYEVQHGTGRLDVDFCSITIDNSLNNDPLQQRLHGISRQRDELQQMEIDLRAQIIVRSEILEMQNSFDAQVKEHASAATKLKEHLQEREHRTHELELKMEEKERELCAIKIDNEAVWAKEDLLREQNKELATVRRERENSEAEKGQHLAEICDLKRHIQDKERQFLEMEEQHRVAQETILYKDEQLREAQAWITRVQEMDALQSTTLQAELRERIEQFNQLWLGCQRQFADMERHHLQTIQQLQLELAEARERSGIYGDNARITRANSMDASPYVQNKGTRFNVNETGYISGNSGILPNGSMDTSTKIEHAPGLPVPSSILGMGPFLPPGQVTTLHPFVMHQHGLPHSVPSSNPHVPQSHVGHFQPIPAVASHQHWQNQQAMADSSQIPNYSQYQASDAEQGPLRPETHFEYERSADGQVVHSDSVEAPISPQQRSNKEEQVLESNDEQYVVSQDPQKFTEETASQFRDSLRLDGHEQKCESKVILDNNVVQQVDKKWVHGSNLSHPRRHEKNEVAVSDQSEVKQGLNIEQPWSSAMLDQSIHCGDVEECNAGGGVLSEGHISVGPTSGLLTHGKIVDPALLDERSLLACLVRAIPVGSSGRIRISTTLPNRLGKMLAPLHWHDYKKQYGKLDEFVACHPELFVIEGDFIHLREGAQAIISATTAAAKVAAAAAASAPGSALLPAVAVTPVAQMHRMKRNPSTNPNSAKRILCVEPAVTGSPADVCDKPSQLLILPKQESNGFCFNFIQGSGYPSIKILSKSKDLQEQNCFAIETRPANTSVNIAVGNGTKVEKTGLAALQSKGSSNGRNGMNFAVKKQGRHTGGGLVSKR